MIIKNIELKNFQVIEDFSANFEGNVYFVTGDNELGKSTLLKAIGALLTGERDAVLRNGEEKGYAKMVVAGDGNEYEVKLSFTKNNPRGTLTITSNNGFKTNNVSALQQIFGYIDYDAVEFSRWSETAEGRRKQVAIVNSLLPEATRLRIAQIDNLVADIKDKRKESNNRVKTLHALCNEVDSQLEEGDRQKYAEEMPISNLMEEQAKNAQLAEKEKSVRASLEQRTAQLAEIPTRREEAKNEYDNKLYNNKGSITGEHERYAAELENAEKEYKAKLEKLKADHQVKLEWLERAHEDIQNDYEELVEKIDTEEADYKMRKANAEKWLANYDEQIKNTKDFATLIAEVEEHNRKHALVVLSKKREQDMVMEEADVNSYEAKLLTLAEERAKLIEDAELPISGLSFTEDGLELNGIPFVAGKVSDSQIMEVATKLIIASNPNVKVFRIARGESLGAKRLQTIIDIAKRNGFQGFIEEVRRGQSDMIIEEYNEKD